jgi:hypothetical protein
MSISFVVPDNLPSGNTNSYEPLPKGKYETTIYDVQLDTVKSGDNAGKPRWKVQLRVSDGQFENRRLFTLIPLYVAGDFWKTQAFFEALGFDVKAGQFTVPEPQALLGKAIAARVTIREAQGDYPADNNVSGYDKAGEVKTEDLLASTLGATPANPFGETF